MYGRYLIDMSDDSWFQNPWKVEKYNTKKYSMLGKIKANWYKAEKSDVVGITCFYCKKSLKSNNSKIYLKLNVQKGDPYGQGRDFEANFYIHKNCLAALLSDCPYEEIKTLKELDVS